MSAFHPKLTLGDQLRELGEVDIPARDHADDRSGDRSPGPPLPGREDGPRQHRLGNGAHGPWVGAAEAFGGACDDRLGGAVWIFSNVAIPHAKYGPTFASKPLVTNQVSLGIRVLATVNLDDEPRLAASEINDVWTDRQLPREFRPETREQAPNRSFLAGST